MARHRLDHLMVVRGLAPSRERARALILAGDVHVSGVTAIKAGTLVDEQTEIVLRRPDHPWVGRGGVKLAHALETFQLLVTDAEALDIGASTGGFTDVLLQSGARHVVALDVGHAQLDWKLRTDARVSVIEGLNARAVTAADLPPDHHRFDLIVVDVSFISLRHILPRLPALMKPDAAVVVLVKPQFEAGRADVGKGGIVRDPEVHARVLTSVTEEAHRVGLERRAMTPSPIEGAEGNREFLVLFGLRPPAPELP